jgi:hypothetical protein
MARTNAAARAAVGSCVVARGGGWVMIADELRMAMRLSILAAESAGRIERRLDDALPDDLRDRMERSRAAAIGEAHGYMRRALEIALDISDP